MRTSGLTLRSRAGHAELVPRWIEQHHPATAIRRAMVVRDLRAERQKTVDLRITVPLTWLKADMHTILHSFVSPEHARTAGRERCRPRDCPPEARARFGPPRQASAASRELPPRTRRSSLDPCYPRTDTECECPHADSDARPIRLSIAYPVGAPVPWQSEARSAQLIALGPSDEETGSTLRAIAALPRRGRLARWPWE